MKNIFRLENRLTSCHITCHIRFQGIKKPHSRYRKRGLKWRRGDSNPKGATTEPLQLCDNSTTKPHIQPPKWLLAEQNDTLPIQKNNTSKHQTGANMVHELTDNSSDPMLCKIVEAWPELPDHIKQTIQTLVGTVTIAGNDNVNK